MWREGNFSFKVTQIHFQKTQYLFGSASQDLCILSKTPQGALFLSFEIIQ